MVVSDFQLLAFKISASLNRKYYLFGERDDSYFCFRSGDEKPQAKTHIGLLTKSHQTLKIEIEILSII